jgi:hypothetical protein
MLSNRRRVHRILLPRAAAQTQSRIQTKAIAARREELIAEMKQLQEQCELPSRLAGTVHSLLTRSWRRSNWRGRAQILKAADWLIRLETTLPASSTVKGGGTQW